MAAIGAIVSPLHLKMKFITPEGIGEVCGRQESGSHLSQSQDINMVSVCSDVPDDKTKRAEPNEKLEVIEFQPGNKDKTFRIDTTLAKDHKEGLIEVIREFQDVFAWNPADMPGVDPQVALHKLHADPTFKPVKQKKRNFNEEKL